MPHAIATGSKAADLSAREKEKKKRSKGLKGGKEEAIAFRLEAIASRSKDATRGSWPHY